jgi:ATP-binding cassette, subfamily F, member 1
MAAQALDGTPIPSVVDDMTRKERRAMEAKNSLEEKAQEVRDEQINSPYSVTFSHINQDTRDLVVRELSISIGGKTLLENSEVKFISGGRYGLMGPNGVGKSSLFRCIASGEVPIPKHLTLHVVDQEAEVTEQDTLVWQVVLKSHTKRTGYITRAQELEAKESMTDEEMNEYDEIQMELVGIGEDQVEIKVRKILLGLGFPLEWHVRQTKTFSGGWRKRIFLACAIFMEPDILFLDEPTNHLDLDAVIWLENILPMIYNSKGKKTKTCVIVSHDLDFLDTVCTDMVSLDSKRLLYYKGGVDSYLVGRQEQLNACDKALELQAKEISRMKKSKGMSKKDVSGVFQERAKKEGVASVILEKKYAYRVSFDLGNPSELRDPKIASISDVSFSYPLSDTLFEDVDFCLWSTSRVAIVGPNGVGKSTFLNLITGDLEPTSGRVEVNSKAKVSKYTQHFVDSIPQDCTPCEFLIEGKGLQRDEARKRLGSFGLEGRVHTQQMTTLSGGQKARVALAAVTSEDSHLIIFDEPTNHLDIESVMALAEAIKAYEGGILLVTHDSRLIKETECDIYLLDDKTLSRWKSSLDEYKEYFIEKLELKKEEKERNQLIANEMKAAKKRREKISAAL